MQTAPLLYEAYIATGKVKHVFVQHPLDSLHPKARPAAEAALCASRQGAAAFWEYHEILFEKASEWGGQENLTEIFAGYAKEMGLDTEAFVSCVESRETADQVQAELQRGDAQGVGGVPAFFINDWFISGAYPFEAFEEVIEKALVGEHPAPTPTPLPEGKTVFDASPDRPGYTFGGDAYFGSADAPLALVAFTDFSSVDNRAFVIDTWPGLAKDYVETSKVRLVIKYFPATNVAAAFAAAVAAECAGEQGNYWGMYDALFEEQAEWTQAADVQSALLDLAREVGLVEADFQACVGEGTAAEKVNADLSIAMQNSFPPAPQFFVFSATQGGYAPAETLRQSLDEFAPQ